MEEKTGFLNINTQNKLIILGSLLSSMLVVLTAWIVIDNTQKTILKGYYNFGLMLVKSLSVESADMISNVSSQEKYQKLKTKANIVIKNNYDISYVVFKDSLGNVIYSNENNFSLNRKNIIEVSAPMVIAIKGVKTVIGSVQIGLTGKTMSDVGKATRNLMIVIFSIAWILSITAVFINTLLITKQIKYLSEGVKRIITGEFGYKLASKDVWGEIKQLFDSFNDMSVRLRQYEEKNIDQLSYEKNKLEAVLMSIANGVVVCDSYDKIILVNNASVKMLNMKAQELLGKKILDYCDLNGNLCFNEHIKQFKDTPLEEIESKPLNCQIKVDNKIIQTIMSPIFTLNQEYLGYIVVLHDITREAEIDKLKNTFISNVSHELRTPVTVLRSYIDTLYNYGNEFDEATKKEFIDVINQESDRLNKMVNDILDFSRLESPEVEIEKALSEVGPIIELTIRSMKVLAEDKKLTFSVLIENDLPKIMINPESIERVLKNLLSNAIKYSNENGRIKIKAEVDRSGHYLQVSVEDNGIGVPVEHIDKIFDRFYRVENKIHTIKGTGLGLHLVKIAIEKHHKGEVFVESKVNEGSVFGFKIPLVASEVSV